MANFLLILSEGKVRFEWSLAFQGTTSFLTERKPTLSHLGMLYFVGFDASLMEMRDLP